MAVLEMIGPEIEVRAYDEWNGRWSTALKPPDDRNYDVWLASITEGFCPPSASWRQQEALAQVSDVVTREPWLICPHGTWFRLVWNQLEEL